MFTKPQRIMHCQPVLRECFQLASSPHLQLARQRVRPFRSKLSLQLVRACCGFAGKSLSAEGEQRTDHEASLATEARQSKTRRTSSNEPASRMSCGMLACYHAAAVNPSHPEPQHETFRLPQRLLCGLQLRPNKGARHLQLLLDHVLAYLDDRQRFRIGHSAGHENPCLGHASVIQVSWRQVRRTLADLVSYVDLYSESITGRSYKYRQDFGLLAKALAICCKSGFNDPVIMGKISP